MSARTAAEPALVVFDFDGTLYRGDCGTDWVVWLLREQPWRWLLALPLVPVFGPLYLIMRWRRVAISAFLWVASVGLSSVDETARHAHFVRDRAGLLRGRLLVDGLACLHRHRLAGDRVVIATGAPPALVEQILELLAHEPLPVVGTRLGVRAGGLIALRHCHGAEKLRMLREAGFEAPVAVAYSDSLVDLPLLVSAQQPVVVNARRSAQAAFAQALGAHMHSLRWVNSGPAA